MKVKTGVPKPKSFKKQIHGGITKNKKNSKSTSGAVKKNIVKITDAFEVLKSGNDLTGISCSKEPKPTKKKSAKLSNETNKIDDAATKSSKNVKKGSKKPVVPQKEKKPKKETTDGVPKMSMKSKVLESTMTEVNSDDSEPKLDIEKVEAAVKGLFILLKNQSTNTKTELWDEPIPIHLVITAVKMGVGPKRVLRIALPNSLITDTTDICLIVPDLVRGRNVDHEKTYHHYKDLLAEKGIKNIKTILPARQIRVEYNEYEARRNLCHSHDVFLIDQKISSFMIKKLGKEFYIKRKFPITVKLNKNHLKEELESKLRKTSFFLDYKGTTKAVQVGHVQQTPKQVAQNIIAVFKYLEYNYPGGLKNIRTLLIKSPTSESLPIYYSMISRNEVKGPYSKSQLFSKDKEVEGDLFGKRVLVKPNGDITVLSGSEESDYDEDNNVEVANKKKNKTNDDEDSDVEEDNEEDEQSDSSVDREDENKSIKKDGSESDEADTEGENGDDAEAEYLMEFEQTKKLQKKKRKKENEYNEPDEVKNKLLAKNIKGKKSLEIKNKKINKAVAVRNKKLNK